MTPLAIAYFCPTAQAFWRWDEDLEALVWRSSGEHLIFRQELEMILWEVCNIGLPSLDALLLILAACGDRLENDRLLEEFEQRQRKRVLQSLKVVRGNREGLFERSLTKARLLEMLLESSVEVNRFTPEDSRHIISQMRAGLDDRLLTRRTSISRTAEDTVGELETLMAGFDVEAFLSRVRTGLDDGEVASLRSELVDLLQRRMAEGDEPDETEQEDLIKRMARDPRLAAMAKIIHRLVGVVQLPRQVSRMDNQPLGGFSDISNRGQLDRLLISELAHDEETLAVRVATNEALYLRRELPPQSPNVARRVLLDTGLRNWGLSRVYATAVALSFQESAGPGVEVDFGTLRRNDFESVTLNTPSDVKRQLEELSPELHAGEALAELAAEAPPSSEEEIVLITAADNLADPDFKRAVRSVSGGSVYIAGVDGDGALAVFQKAGGGLRKLTEIRLDLEELVPSGTSDAAKIAQRRKQGRLPMIFDRRIFPLLLPAQISTRRCAFHPKHGAAAILADHRLLHWAEPDHGARTLCETVTFGRRPFLHISDNGAVSVVTDTGEVDTPLRLYTFDSRTLERDAVTIVSGGKRVQDVLFSHSSIELVHMSEQGETLIESFSAATGDKIDAQIVGLRWRGDYLENMSGERFILYNSGTKLVIENMPDRPRAFPVPGASEDTQRETEATIRKLIEPPAPCFTHLHKVGILGRSKILVWASPERPYVLNIDSRERIAFESWTRPDSAMIRAEAFFVPVDAPDGVGWTLQEASLPDGSRAFCDSRGLLHLVSSDANVPELTFVLVKEKPTAAWASDGKHAGQSYYTGHRVSFTSSIKEYLQDFIDSI